MCSTPAFSGHGVALYSIHDTPGELTNDVNTRSSPSHRKRIKSRKSNDNEDVTEERNSDALSIDMQPTLATTIDMDTDVVSSQVDPKDMDLANRLAHHQYQSRDFLLSPEHAGGNASSILSPSGQGLEGVLDSDMPSESPGSENDDEEWDIDDDEGQDTEHRNEPSDQSGWAGAPVVYPRCVYKGARNIETVKDGQSSLAFRDDMYHLLNLRISYFASQYPSAEHEATKSVVARTMGTGSCGTRLLAVSRVSGRATNR